MMVMMFTLIYGAGNMCFCFTKDARGARAHMRQGHIVCMTCGVYIACNVPIDVCLNLYMRVRDVDLENQYQLSIVVSAKDASHTEQFAILSTR